LSWVKILLFIAFIGAVIAGIVVLATRK
jgi:hypothetical protein